MMRPRQRNELFTYFWKVEAGDCFLSESLVLFLRVFVLVQTNVRRLFQLQGAVEEGGRSCFLIGGR